MKQKTTASKKAKKVTVEETSQTDNHVSIVDSIVQQGNYQEVELRKIEIRSNVRKKLDEKSISELAESIRRNGLLQAITIMEKEPDHYVLVAGERRFRACQHLEWQHIGAMVRPYNEEEFLRLQILENLQRKQVHPLEEADGFARLLSQGNTITDIALQLGKSETFIHLRLKLNELAQEWKTLFQKGEISFQSALEIARLLPAMQAELHQVISQAYAANRFQTVYIHAKINELLLQLGKAPFDTADATLCGGCCRSCQKRTGAQTTLFPSVSLEKDRCLDRACFEEKTMVFYQRILEAERAANPDVLLVCNRYSQEQWVETPFGQALSYRCWNHSYTTDGTRAVVVDMDRGKVEVKNIRLSTPQSSTDSKPEPGQRAKTIRDNKIRRTTKRVLYENLLRDEKPHLVDYYLPHVVQKARKEVREWIELQGFSLVELNDSTPEAGKSWAEWRKETLKRWADKNLASLSLEEKNELYFSILLREGLTDDFNTHVNEVATHLGYDMDASIEQATKEVDTPKPKKEKNKKQRTVSTPLPEELPSQQRSLPEKPTATVESTSYEEAA